MQQVATHVSHFSHHPEEVVFYDVTCQPWFFDQQMIPINKMTNITVEHLGHPFPISLSVSGDLLVTFAVLCAGIPPGQNQSSRVRCLSTDLRCTYWPSRQVFGGGTEDKEEFLRHLQGRSDPSTTCPSMGVDNTLPSRSL